MALTTLTERVQQRAANVAGPEDFRHDRGEGVNETTAGHGHDIQQWWADIEAALPKHVSVDLFPAALRQVPPKVRKCTRRSRRLQDGGLTGRLLALPGEHQHDRLQEIVSSVITTPSGWSAVTGAISSRIR